jgi:hypothetical protein
VGPNESIEVGPDLSIEITSGLDLIFGFENKSRRRLSTSAALVMVTTML